MQSWPKQLTTILDVEDDESISLLTAARNETSRTPPSAQGLKSITIQTQLQHDSPSLIALCNLHLARVLQLVTERNKTWAAVTCKEHQCMYRQIYLMLVHSGNIGISKQWLNYLWVFNIQLECGACVGEVKPWNIWQPNHFDSGENYRQSLLFAHIFPWEWNYMSLSLALCSTNARHTS